MSPGAGLHGMHNLAYHRKNVILGGPRQFPSFNQNGWRSRQSQFRGQPRAARDPRRSWFLHAFREESRVGDRRCSRKAPPGSVGEGICVLVRDIQEFSKPALSGRALSGMCRLERIPVLPKRKVEEYNPHLLAKLSLYRRQRSFVKSSTERTLDILKHDYMHHRRVTIIRQRDTLTDKSRPSFDPFQGTRGFVVGRRQLTPCEYHGDDTRWSCPVSVDR